MSDEWKATMLDTPDPRECLPPDPSISGLWWVQSKRPGNLGAGLIWEVWRWKSVGQCWWRGSSVWEPELAAAAGWRCIEPAVPPGDVP